MNPRLVFGFTLAFALLLPFIWASCKKPQGQSSPTKPKQDSRSENREKILRGIEAAQARTDAKAAKQAEAEREARFTAQAAARSAEQLNTQLMEWAKDAVKQRLKAPSTAKFPGTILERSEYKIYLMPDGAYRVFSWVDSQNSFGAMLRSGWLVEFKKTGDQWEVLKVTVE